MRSPIERDILEVLRREGPLNSLDVRANLREYDPKDVTRALRKMSGRSIRRKTSDKRHSPIWEAL